MLTSPITSSIIHHHLFTPNPNPPPVYLQFHHRHRHRRLALLSSSFSSSSSPNILRSRTPLVVASASTSPAEPDHPPSAPSSASSAQVEMFRGRDGVWSTRPQTVVVLWDLDNKPPRGPPYDAALALRRASELLGRVVDFSAYANRHAFLHLPQWVIHQRRERRHLDVLERKGLVEPDEETYVCGVCGRKCRTNLDLKKHFRQLHVRERQKKLDRMRSLKGKKRQRYRERFVAGNHKYEEAARQLLTPRTGYGLASELRRAGVFVKTVADKPQAADWALKRQMQHSMARGVDWLVLVSDDSDFSEMVRRAREEADLRTVVVGDGRTALGRQADLWMPWARVENGEVNEEVLRLGLANGMVEDYDVEDVVEDESSFTYATFYEHRDMSDVDETVDDVVAGISAFSEEEVLKGDGFLEEFGSTGSSNPFLWDSEEEEEDEDI